MKKLFKIATIAALVSVLCGCDSTGTDDTDGQDASATKIQNISKIDPSIADQVDFTLEILHLNDVHSYIDPTGVTLRTPKGMVRVRAGGPEAIKSVVEARRKANPNVVFISAGDQITGNASNYDLFKGKADAALHGMYGIDFYMLGNHEFDHGGNGIATFMKYMKELSPQAVMLNSDLSVGPNSPIKDDVGVPEVLKEIDGHNVFFYATTTGKKIKASSSPDPDMEFADSVSTINAMTAKNADKANIHVLITHRGVIADRHDAALLNDVDIIVGGDSHSLCGNFSKYGLHGECTYPMTRVNATGHKICVVQANEYGKIIGDLKVSFDKDGNVLKCEGSPFMPLWSETASLKNVKNADFDVKAAAVAAIKDVIADPNSTFVEAQFNQVANDAIKPYRDEIKKQFNYLGKAPQDLCTTRFPNEDCVIKSAPNPYGSETCRMLGQVYLAESKSGADMFLGNSGMFRVDLEEGDFTDAELLAITPFSNNLQTVTMKGSEVVALLNQVVRYIREDVTARDGGTPCGYGFSYAMDLSAKNPVSKVMITDQQGNGKAIDLNKTYTILSTSYILNGKDGYGIFKKKKKGALLGADSVAIKSYLSKHGAFPELPENSRTITDFKE